MSAAQRRLLAALPWLAAIALAGPAPAATSVDLHALTWHVHIDLTDQGAGSQPLSFYEGLIAEATSRATLLVKGDQGPFEGPCCAELSTVSVSVFGTSGDGLDTPSSAADFAALDAAAGGVGSHAFLVDSLGYCGGPTTTAIGCADRPSCSGDPNDDPFLVLVVTLEAHELFDVLGQALAHERGHNACLVHVSADSCQIMRPAGGGGCLDASECGNYQDGRTGTGGTCECHVDTASFEPDGTVCSEGAVTGACSGGVCQAVVSDASVRLLAAAGAEAMTGASTDDALWLSGATGGWSDQGAIGAGLAPRGLAHAPGRGVVFAVAPSAGDDVLVTLDPATGTQLAGVGTLSGIQDVIALAFDPGPTANPSDDRLLALDDDASSFEDLLEIDPDTASVTVLGGLELGFSSGFQGLAYDSANGALYASSGGSLFEIDLTSCPPGLCSVSEVTAISVPRTGSSLAYSATSQRLYLVGNQSSNTRKLYDTIDASTFEVEETIGIDGFTGGGLAAVDADIPACADGQDNDGDGFTDFPSDPGCFDAASDLESPRCQDGVDNDTQIGTDFDGGESILGVGNGDPNGADPQCVGRPWKNKERRNRRCGLGAELGLLAPLLLRLGRVLRRRAAVV